MRPSETKSVGDFQFGAIIRTQGKRPALLAEALESLSFQRPECTAVVTVHAPFDKVKEVKAVCRDLSVRHEVLHAEDTNRKRGYPLNVGLSYCYGMGGFDALFFLDDDDIVYPAFTRRMAQALSACRGDVIYAASNKRYLGRAPEPAYSPLPIARLLLENFIPINSYAIRFSRLAASQPFFDDSMDYTEDWLFLLHLLAQGFRFQALSDTLSEFRIISDGNTEVKRDPMGWDRDALKVREFINNTLFPLPGNALVGMALQMRDARPAPVPDMGAKIPPPDPRALLLWEKMRRVWHCLPFWLRTWIVRLYQRHLHRGVKG
jgi:hypothetical protein